MSWKHNTRTFSLQALCEHCEWIFWRFVGDSHVTFSFMTCVKICCFQNTNCWHKILNSNREVIDKSHQILSHFCVCPTVAQYVTTPVFIPVTKSDFSLLFCEASQKSGWTDGWLVMRETAHIQGFPFCRIGGGGDHESQGKLPQKFVYEFFAYLTDPCPPEIFFSFH